MFHHRILSLGAAALILTATTLSAGSHSGDLPAPVKARHGQMQLYAFNLGTLGAMAKGEVAYDAEAASAAAANLLALATLNAGPMWAPGTDSDSLDGSRALPAIWENFPDVGAKAGAMVEAATAMNAAAGNGLDALQAAMGPVGGACGGCHKVYRAEE